MEFSSEKYPPINGIEYISGNCEEYDYTGITTLIMSHVFEHLYNPREFLQKIAKTNIQNIFISIPDMDGLMNTGDVNNLNILHTFYINTKYIVYLFQLFGFELKDKFNYTNNSVFYYFSKNTPLVLEYQNVDLLTSIPIFYQKMSGIIQNIQISEPFYICPSGFYGQFIYFNLNDETKKNILGFLDGDKYKINKRLSGTPLTIYEKKHISNVGIVTILISSSKHSNEIREELMGYNNQLKFIDI